jgi:uncharacterized protein YjgD (DUF1641 family)
MTDKAMQEQIALLHQKVDLLTEGLEAQNRRQRDLDELKQDLIPIANHMIKLSIDELADIGSEFQLEDLFFLLKRVLRNTSTLLLLLDRMEAVMGLAEEAGLIGKQVFANAVDELDRLEQHGFFAFAREGWRIVDRIVTEFSEEDVRALGDNIVTILSTVRRMTQPEVLQMANQAMSALEPTDDVKISTLELVRELSDPKVRIGLARMLQMLKVLADQPAASSAN